MVAAASYEGPHLVVNVGSGRGRSILEVAGDVAAALGRPPPRIAYRASRRGDVPANVLDISRAREVLDWQPRTDWMDGLRLTAAWINKAFPARS